MTSLSFYGINVTLLSLDSTMDGYPRCAGSPAEPIGKVHTAGVDQLMNPLVSVLSLGGLLVEARDCQCG